MAQKQASQIAAFLTQALQWQDGALLPPDTPLIAKIEIDGRPDSWVAVYGNTLDFAFVGDQPPDTFVQSVFASVPSCQVVDWSPGRLATIEYGPVELQSLSGTVDLLFETLYSLKDYSIVGTIERFGCA
jgi:hypothetical protein